MNLLNEFKRHLLEGRFFNNQDRLLVAVSTGVDSMVLIDLLQRLPKSQRPFIMVAHVNHHLRAQSTQEESFIREYCLDHDLPVMIHQWQPDQHPQTGIEAAARAMRYHFFAQVMGDQRLTRLVTAHHGDDLAETMLMKLTRGGQLNQLVGIADQRPFHNGQLIRPLLPFSKQDLLTYAHNRHLKWYEDATNQDLDIQRNRYRHLIMPLLKRENPQFLQHMYHYHQQLVTAIKMNQKIIDEQLSTMTTPNGHLDLAQFVNLAADQREVILRRWLAQHEIHDLKDNQLREINQSLINQQNAHLSVPLPNGQSLQKDYSDLFVQKRNENDIHQQFLPDSVVKFEHWYPLDSDRQLAAASTTNFFDPTHDQIMEMWLPPHQLPLYLRRWHSGDQLRLKGGKHQSVRRILINQKVPSITRSQQRVLTLADGSILTLIGHKWAWLDRPADYRQRWVHFFVGLRRYKGEKHE